MRVARRQTVISDEVEGTTMLCDTECVQFYRLNSTGARIWALCEGASVREIVTRLEMEYPTEDAGRIGDLVEKFVASLVETSLVNVVKS